MADTTITLNEIPWRETDVLIFPAELVDGDRVHGNPPSNHDPVQTIAVGDEGSMDVTVAGESAAVLVTGLEVSDNAIEWTAQDEGSAGNDITIAMTDPGANDQSIDVNVTDLAIEVLLATDSGGVVTSTADQVKTAVAGDVAANALVAVADSGASDGSGVVAPVVATNLGGGDDNLSAGRYVAFGFVPYPVTTGFPDDDESGVQYRSVYREFRVT